MNYVATAENQHIYARQLDDDRVVYLMSIDPWGDVAASVRLNPTTGQTLLKKFASWSDKALPVGDD